MGLNQKLILDGHEEKLGIFGVRYGNVCSWHLLRASVSKQCDNCLWQNMDWCLREDWSVEGLLIPYLCIRMAFV